MRDTAGPAIATGEAPGLRCPHEEAGGFQADLGGLQAAPPARVVGHPQVEVECREIRRAEMDQAFAGCDYDRQEGRACLDSFGSLPCDPLLDVIIDHEITCELVWDCSVPSG